MDKLKKLKVEKFRILKDSELKEIVGSSSYAECNCGSGCSWRSGGSLNPGWGLTGLGEGRCQYSSVARTCICV